MDGKVVLGFISGLAVGGVATFFALKNSTERYISDEIQAFKEEWAETHKTPENAEYEVTEASESDDEASITEKSVSSLDEGRKKMNSIIEKQNYNQITAKETIAEKDIVIDKELDQEIEPIPITPAQFMAEDGFGSMVVNYIEDEKVVLDDDGNEIPYGLDFIGENNLSHFGEYEADVLYVKNEKTQFKYEVCLYQGMTVQQFLDNELLH